MSLSLSLPPIRIRISRILFFLSRAACELASWRVGAWPFSLLLSAAHAAPPPAGTPQHSAGQRATAAAVSNTRWGAVSCRQSAHSMGHVAISPVPDTRSHALPSPADVLDTPPEQPLTLAQSPGFLRRALRFDDSTAALHPLPEPGHVDAHAVTTPPASDTPFPDMNLIVGGALAPTHTAPPRHCRPSRPSPAGLRLPSFQALGIAAPHPDRFGSLSFQSVAALEMDGTSANLAREEPDTDLSAAIGAGYLSPSHLGPRLGEKPSLAGGRAVVTSIKHDVATLTPPAEIGEMQRLSVRSVSNAPMDSPSTDPTSSFEESQSAAGGAAASGTEPSEISTAASQPLWLDGAVNVLRKSLTDRRVYMQP